MNTLTQTEPSQYIQHENIPSSEEKFVAEFLRECRISFEEQKPLIGLYGDTKKHRVADFYLPKLKVYVEYFGMYNSTKQIRADYDEKARILISNNIPTIFIYPHELGILEYAFHTKMVKLLQIPKFNLQWQLFRYRFNRFWRKSTFSPIFLSLYFIFVIFNIPTGLSKDFSMLILVACIAAGFAGSVKILKNIRSYFFLNK